MGSTKGVTGKFGGNGPSPADHGARNDSFFLDEETHRLFAWKSRMGRSADNGPSLTSIGSGGIAWLPSWRPIPMTIL